MPAWEGGGGNLHLCYTLEMLGVTCVFKNHFHSFFFLSVHCLSDQLGAVAHTHEGGGESYLFFGSL